MRRLPHIFALALLFGSLGLGQEIDTALYQSDRPAYSLLDHVDNAAERQAMSSILAAAAASERLKHAEAFVVNFPRSWHLALAYELAARAALRTGDSAKALRYGKDSLRFFPENALLLGPLAALSEFLNQPQQADRWARQALASLDRFAPPSNISTREWALLESQLRSFSRSVLLRRDQRDQAVETADAAISIRDLTTPQLGARYAGSEVCRGCHPAEHQSWSRTGMARMLRPYQPENVIGEFASGHEFRGDNGAKIRLIRDNTGHFFEVPGPTGETQRLAVDYTIGSKWQQAYATKLEDGRIHVFPIQYNKLHKKWVNYWKIIDPPGSRRTDLAAFHEFSDATNYQLHCAPCHTSQLHFKPASSHRAEDIHFREPGVNCEMCHGPSAEHAATYAAGKVHEKAAAAPPVDFLRIGQRQYVQICAQCHMQSGMFKRGPEGELNHSGDAEIFFQKLRSRPLSEFSKKAFYKDGRFRETTFVVESLLRSKCFTAGKVQCGHCHNPHPKDSIENPKSLKFPDQANQMCLQCHEDVSQDVAAHTQHPVNAEAGQCTACHMPAIMNSLLFKAGTHKIDDIPDAERTARFGQEESPNACLLCHEDRNTQWLTVALRAWGKSEPASADTPAGAVLRESLEPLKQLAAHIDEATAGDPLALLVEAQDWIELEKRVSGKLLRSPDDAGLHYWLGIAQSQVDLVQAGKSFRRAENLGLANSALHKALGLTYYNLYQYNLFLEQMEKAIQASPSDPEPYHYLGRYYESNLSNFPRALSYFEQSLVHDPRNLRSLYFKGYCLQMLDRDEEAAASYEAAIQFVEANNEKYGWPYQKLAELLWERDLAAALRSAKRAVELEPQVADHRLVLAKTYDALEMPDQSLLEREAAAALKPTDPTIQYQLFVLYRKLGKTKEAEGALKRHERLRALYGTPE